MEAACVGAVEPGGLCSDVGSLRGGTQPSFQTGKMKAGLAADSQPQKCQIPAETGIALTPAQPLL